MFTYEIDEGLTLRQIDLADAERVFELTNRSREYLQEWLPWLDGTTKLEDTIGFIDSCMQGAANKTSLTTVILYREEIVGVAGYNNISMANKTAYIGYWLDQEYQGKGMMTRVAQALTDHAFQQLGLNKVEIRAAVENEKSRSIPERLGFVNEGIIRQAEWLYDHYVDHVVYGILAEEWGKRSELDFQRIPVDKLSKVAQKEAGKVKNKKLRILWIVPNVLIWCMFIGLSIWVGTKVEELQEIEMLSFWIIQLLVVLLLAIIGSYQIWSWIKQGKL